MMRYSISIDVSDLSKFDVSDERSVELIEIILKAKASV